jgi:putative acetyltransferase
MPNRFPVKTVFANSSRRLNGVAVQQLLHEHLDGIAKHSPPDRIHVLDLVGLRAARETFWSAWQGEQLLGCGALEVLDDTHAEVKSMRTASGHLRRGVAVQMLTQTIEQARERGYRRVSLETGPSSAFAPHWHCMCAWDSSNAHRFPSTGKIRLASIGRCGCDAAQRWRNRGG